MRTRIRPILSRWVFAAVCAVAVAAVWPYYNGLTAPRTPPEGRTTRPPAIGEGVRAAAGGTYAWATAYVPPGEAVDGQPPGDVRAGRARGVRPGRRTAGRGPRDRRAAGAQPGGRRLSGHVDPAGPAGRHHRPVRRAMAAAHPQPAAAGERDGAGVQPPYGRGAGPGWEGRARRPRRRRGDRRGRARRRTRTSANADTAGARTRLTDRIAHRGAGGRRPPSRPGRPGTPSAARRARRPGASTAARR
ncbi:hypothetical protein SCALM49S_07673 [Streptomyces californicus]